MKTSTVSSVGIGKLSCTCEEHATNNRNYKQWQAMVMEDLDSLKTLVKEVRDRIDFVAPSIVCCNRSARLCRRVGIPVKGQFAFLFPSSYSL